MKIALVQLDGEDKLWSEKNLSYFLRQASGSDLVVFPESMPFARVRPHADAVQVLEAAGQEVADCTFIAGGYVMDGAYRRNRVYLVNGGKVKDYYDKQIVWPGEKFTPGKEAKLFEWDGMKCIPLICADAGDSLIPQKVRMMAAALAAGAGPDAPIVISSYGGGLMTDYWQPALREWSQGCDAPVVICGIAGTHSKKTYVDCKGLEHRFGGGGSGVFWQNGYQFQSPEEGIVVVDVHKRTMTRKDIDRSLGSYPKK